MATAISSPALRTPSFADVLPDHDLPPNRILLYPTPGTATGADVVAIRERERRLCELIDGTLVEKTMGSYESRLGFQLGHWLMAFMETSNLGEGLGADGMIWFLPDQLRQPDIAIYLRERLPGGQLPRDAILTIIPDLVVEILSEGNSKREMDEKRRLYFAAGVRLVWYADPTKREVWVYDAADHGVCLDHAATLDGGAVLPGFALRIGDWLK